MAYKKGDPLIRKNPLFRLASHLTFYTILPIAWLVFYGLYRGKIRGRWRIKDFLKENKNGKAIMVSNHTTFFDPILTSVSIAPYCMYHTLLEATVCTPFLGTFIQLLGGMPVPRGRNASERFTEGIKLALTKRPLVHIYPEGDYFKRIKCSNFSSGNSFQRTSFYFWLEKSSPYSRISYFATDLSKSI